MHWDKSKYVLSWPKALPYPYAIQRSQDPVPNRSSVDWPQAQWNPLYLPPGSGSVQPYRYPENGPLQSIVPEYLRMATPIMHPTPRPPGDIVATSYEAQLYADAMDSYGDPLAYPLNSAERRLHPVLAKKDDEIAKARMHGKAMWEKRTALKKAIQASDGRWSEQDLTYPMKARARKHHPRLANFDDAITKRKLLLDKLEKQRETIAKAAHKKAVKMGTAKPRGLAAALSTAAAVQKMQQLAAAQSRPSYPPVIRPIRVLPPEPERAVPTVRGGMRPVSRPVDLTGGLRPGESGFTEDQVRTLIAFVLADTAHKYYDTAKFFKNKAGTPRSKFSASQLRAIDAMLSWAQATSASPYRGRYWTPEQRVVILNILATRPANQQSRALRLASKLAKVTEYLNRTSFSPERQGLFLYQAELLGKQEELCDEVYYQGTGSALIDDEIKKSIARNESVPAPATPDGGPAGPSGASGAVSPTAPLPTPKGGDWAPTLPAWMKNDEVADYAIEKALSDPSNADFAKLVALFKTFQILQAQLAEGTSAEDTKAKMSSAWLEICAEILALLQKGYFPELASSGYVDLSLSDISALGEISALGDGGCGCGGYGDCGCGDYGDGGCGCGADCDCGCAKANPEDEKSNLIKYGLLAAAGVGLYLWWNKR